MVYPHTSNWDFPVMLLVKWAIGITVRFWAKDSLFRVPLLGRWLRHLGGVPVDRQSPQGAVGTMVSLMSEARAHDEICWLALAPEGTRRPSRGWRSGFYRVAVAAGVPVAVIGLDYSRKMVDISQFLNLTGQEEADYAQLAALLDGVTGRHAMLASPIRPLRPAADSNRESV